VSQLDSKSANGGRAVIVKKARPDVYTVMLVVSFLAISIGCLFLYLEILTYGGLGAVKGPI